jgi:hypothetical protein
MIRFLVMAALALVAAPATAASLSATPATIDATFKAARCGDSVELKPGAYGIVTAPRLSCPVAQPLAIAAWSARLTSLTIRGATGVDWQGGSLVAPREQAVGATVDASSRVRVAFMTVTGPRVGISVARSNAIDVEGNSFDGVRSDGVNVTISHHIRIIGNRCVNFDPIPATYDQAGNLLVDGDHPDCVQIWSQVGTFAVHDVEVTGNTAYGLMQFIFLGRASPLGFDRITVTGNTGTIGAYNGIVGYDVRSALIRGNTVRTVPDARLQGGNRGLIKAWIKMIESKGVTACGNVVEAWPGGEGTATCRSN